MAAPKDHYAKAMESLIRGVRDAYGKIAMETRDTVVELDVKLATPCGAVKLVAVPTHKLEEFRAALAHMKSLGCYRDMEAERRDA